MSGPKAWIMDIEEKSGTPVYKKITESEHIPEAMNFAVGP